MRKRTKAIVLVSIALANLGISCDNDNSKQAYRELEDQTNSYANSYVGNQSCSQCHQKAVNDWEGSHHDKAMQVANASTVLGDFADLKVMLDGVSYFFYRNDQDFHVRVNELDGSEIDYKVSYVFGIQPLQQYMVDFPSGRKQVLRVSWDTDQNKWFHQYAGDKINPNDWLHWTRGGQNWNTMCAECHSTNLQKNYFIAKDSFDTTYSEINVSCESCHGPAEKHLRWASTGQTKGDMEILAGTQQLQQMNLCAPCHARRVKLTKNLEPGLKFEDQYLLQNITSEYYHLDGQILEEDYVYGSFVQSKMYKQGIRCADCHNVHSLKLKKQGNDLCLQCHVPDTYNSEKHHFHQMGTEASDCVSCHMTGRYYMGNDFRRDHSFRIPRPDQSMEYDTPNACNECHDKQSAKWAADWVKTWYGENRQPHFSDQLMLNYKEELSDADKQSLYAFINDLNYPAIARATAIDLMSFEDQEGLESLIKALNDSSAQVRYNALMQFRGLEMQERLTIAQKHLTDSVALVRIGAAQLLTGFDGSSMAQGMGLDISNATSEYEAMLYASADFAAGRLQLGDYFMQNRDVQSAIGHYEMALKKDSLLMPVYSNLATAYAMTGKTDRALETLATWMYYDDDSGRPYYLRGLLHFELGNNDLAVEDLMIATEKDPQDSRSRYNLATFWYQNKNYAQAEQMIRSALELEENNEDYNYLLYLILNEQGRRSEARKLMGKLNRAAATR